MKQQVRIYKILKCLPPRLEACTTKQPRVGRVPAVACCCSGIAAKPVLHAHTYKRRRRHKASYITFHPYPSPSLIV